MLRAWRVCLDPTREQHASLARNAGAARWAFKYALDRKVTAHRAFTAARDRALEGVSHRADRGPAEGRRGFRPGCGGHDPVLV